MLSTDISLAHGMLSLAEISLIKSLISTSNIPNDAIIVNIGIGPGTSCVVFKEVLPDCKLYAIDVSYEAGKIFSRLIGKESATFILANSQRVKLDVSYIDILFIDGDHTYEGVKADITNWMLLVRPEGLIFFHDYPTNGKIHPKKNVENARQAVKRAVDEWAKDKKPTGQEKILIAFRK